MMGKSTAITKVNRLNSSRKLTDLQVLDRIVEYPIGD